MILNERAEKMLDYIKARLNEKSTHAGLGLLAGSFGVSALCLFFPQYASIIQMIAGALGVSVMAIPTGGKPDA